MTADPSLWLAVVAAYGAAGVVKGTVGIGLPAAAVGITAQIVEPRLAVGLVVFPSLLSNVWQVWRTGGIGGTLGAYAPFLASLAVVIATVSATVTSGIPTGALMLALGAVMVIFAVTSLALDPPAIPDRLDRPAQVLAGSLSGVLGGLTAIWAPPMVIYLLGRGVTGEAFVRASGVIILVGTVPLIGGFWAGGLIDLPIAAVSVALTVPAIAGWMVGERLRRRLDADRFRRVVLFVFLAMGANLIRRSLG